MLHIHKSRAHDLESPKDGHNSDHDELTILIDALKASLTQVLHNTNDKQKGHNYDPSILKHLLSTSSLEHILHDCIDTTVNDIAYKAILYNTTDNNNQASVAEHVDSVSYKAILKHVITTLINLKYRYIHLLSYISTFSVYTQ